MKDKMAFWKQHREALTLLYFPIYLLWFFWLEQVNPEHIYIVTNPLDRWIPFCEYFIIPYLLWFPYLFGSIIWLYFADRKKGFLKLTFSLIIGLTICLIIYTFFPNGQALRLESYPNHNFFTRIVAMLQGFDTPTNVCPSIHAFSTVVVHIALQRSSCHRGVKMASFVLMVLICLSTVCLKQHSLTDVIWALVLVVPICGIIYGKRHGKAMTSSDKQSE